MIHLSQLEKIFEEAARKAEEENRPTLKIISEFVSRKFTKEAGFTVTDNSRGSLPATEINISSERILAATDRTNGNFTIKDNGDGTFHLKYNNRHGGFNRTSIEKTFELLGAFYGKGKLPAPVKKDGLWEW